MPDKLFYKIGEVGRITGLPPYVLRFWETEFPSLHPKKSKGKQRIYTQKEIDLALQIKKMLYQEGMTIAGAKKRLSRSERSAAESAQDALWTIKKELEEVLHILS
ncbi:MAG TPA: MerR family transcriptional regulator [Candidatus Manganitrophaceae bacterium]|nr:MerR family transcriptional regulator [Candidatus Manganitrophaceae bacterium]